MFSFVVAFTFINPECNTSAILHNVLDLLLLGWFSQLSSGDSVVQLLTSPYHNGNLGADLLLLMIHCE